MVIGRSVIKSALIATSFGGVVFLVLMYVLMTKSFYPYQMTFFATSPVLHLIDPIKFTQTVKTSIGDTKGGVFHIDAVERMDNPDEFRFTGRYYKLSAVDARSDDVKIMFTDLMSQKISSYLALQLCVILFPTDDDDFLSQVALFTERKVACEKEITTAAGKVFKINSLTFTDDQRSEKIIFLSAVVAVFFAAFVFAYIEGRRV